MQKMFSGFNCFNFFYTWSLFLYLADDSLPRSDQCMNPFHSRTFTESWEKEEHNVTTLLIFH